MGVYYTKAKGTYDSRHSVDTGTSENEHTPWLRLAFTLMVMDIAERAGYVNKDGEVRVVSLADAQRYMAAHPDDCKKVYYTLHDIACGNMDEKRISTRALGYAEAAAWN
jgi:hypothetical protein